MYDIIIIGGGPAGLTAAIYARRNGKSVLLLEKEGFGGQIATAPLVENYPGVASVEGTVLAEQMAQQALDLDTDTDIGTVISLELRGEEKLVRTQEGDTYVGRTVILATGAKHAALGLPGEGELLGQGVSYCAVCDGSFYRGEDVAVVGGGDSALQEAILLSDICRRVYLIHRRRELRGDAAKQQTLQQRQNVELLTPMEVTGFQTEGGELSGLELKNRESGESRTLPVRALFVSVGREPELGDFRNLVKLSESGYALVGEDCSAGNGIFVAGDCREKAVRQLTTAVGDGAAAALAACRYLDQA